MPYQLTCHLRRHQLFHKHFYETKSFLSSSKLDSWNSFSILPLIYLNNESSKRTFKGTRHLNAIENSESFLQGSAANYVEEMFQAWKRDKNSVHISWQTYFNNVDHNVKPGNAFTPPPTIQQVNTKNTDHSSNTSVPFVGGELTPNIPKGSSEIVDHLKVQLLVRAYQVRGHHLANLDPLGIMQPALTNSTPPELELSHYGLTEKDMDRTFQLGDGMLPGFSQVKEMTLKEILSTLKQTYCKLS